MGSTGEPSFSAASGTMPRKIASYARTVPDASLASKANRTSSKVCRRKSSCSAVSDAAGGRTPSADGADDAARSGIGADGASVPSPTITGRGRFGPESFRSTGGGRPDAAALLDATEKAACENMSKRQN